MRSLCPTPDFCAGNCVAPTHRSRTRTLDVLKQKLKARSLRHDCARAKQNNARTKIPRSLITQQSDLRRQLQPKHVPIRPRTTNLMQALLLDRPTPQCACEASSPQPPPSRPRGWPFRKGHKGRPDQLLLSFAHFPHSAHSKTPRNIIEICLLFPAPTQACTEDFFQPRIRHTNVHPHCRLDLAPLAPRAPHKSAIAPRGVQLDRRHLFTGLHQ